MHRGFSIVGALVTGWMGCTPIHDLNEVTGGSIGSGSNTGGSASSSGGTTASGGSEMAGGSGGTTASGGSEAAGGSGSSPEPTGGTSSGGTDASGGGGGAAPVDEFCGPERVFCEDFEDGSADGFQVSGGSWGVLTTNGNFAYRGVGSEEAVVGDDSWTNIVYEARVRVVSFGDATEGHRVGIIGRYADSSSFYVFSVGGDGNATLKKSTSDLGGALGTCDAVPIDFAPGQWLDMRLEIQGPAANVIVSSFVDGEPIHSCTTTSNTVEMGRVGVATFGSGTEGEFDDLRVTLLE